MQNDPNYVISVIKDGQYEVRLNLDKWISSKYIESFLDIFQHIFLEDDGFSKVCSIEDHFLKYRSESLFPEANKIDPNKKKILIILGNPATNSVVNGMFFFSRTNGDRHQFWGKLEKAGLIQKLNKCIDDREKEAIIRRTAIYSGNTSDKYVLGLTTFYSLPTPVKPGNIDEVRKYPNKNRYGDAMGVEKLFVTSLQRLQEMEYDRINSYVFAKNAIWVFTQKSSYEYVQKLKNVNSAKYWPMSSRKSDKGGGSYLKSLLSNGDL